jgi:hypothetical protein
MPDRIDPDQISDTVREAVQRPQEGNLEHSLHRLQQIRREQIRELERSALGHPAIVESIAARIQHLTTAITALEKGASRKRNRTLAIVLVSLTIVLTGTLLLLRRPTANVSAKTRSSTISFETVNPVSFFEGVGELESIHFVGQSTIRPETGTPVQAGPNDD